LDGIDGSKRWGTIPTGDVNRGYGDQAETRTKLSALRASMFGADVDAVYLEGFANVAWLCGGRGNRVVIDSPTGLCGILVGANGAWLLAPNNEESRLRAEVFAELPLPVVTRAWYELPLWQAARPLLPEAARWLADVPVPGAGDAGSMMAELRRVLGEPDMKRYRSLGADAAEALETALLEVRPGWSEIEVAGAMTAALKAREIEAAVALVGTLTRAQRFRHLVPTAAPVEGGLIASITAVRHGLHASATRCLSFGAVAADLAEKHATVVEVDTAYLAESRPGINLGQGFAAGEKRFAERGFYDDWKEHHQGGTTGYAGREVLALPGVDYTLAAGMAVAWNPTVPGAKSEDTFLVVEEGIEQLTSAPESKWPLTAGPIPREGILVVS
jgi:Xaa-Pro aminopeptidase